MTSWLGMCFALGPALAAPMQHTDGQAPAPDLLALSRARTVSGTAWQPESTPVYGLHLMAGDLMVMLRGSIFLGYDHQSGRRGDDALTRINWLMLMADHPLAGGEVGARLMLSLEPLTVGSEGYPLLLQTGETDRGRRLVDHQHPHDLLMETALVYTRPLGDSLAVQIYGGPVGEPALGPPAFLHRASAAADPLAPLGHHWQDSTHISFGVVTAGVFGRFFKLEGSWFNGREPDEERYDLDLRGFDSYAGRLSLHLMPWLVLQGSYGYLGAPEVLEPGIAVHRVTASASVDTPLEHGGNLAALLLWGHNHPIGRPMSDAFLLEWDLTLSGRHELFGRFEYVRKSAEELVLPALPQDRLLGVSSLALGVGHNFRPIASLEPGVGIQGSIHPLGDALADAYGSSVPYGVMVYLRLRTARAIAAEHEHHDQAPARTDHAGHGAHGP